MARPARQPPPWFVDPANRLRFLRTLELDCPEARITAPRREFRGRFAVSTRIEPTGVDQRAIVIVFTLGRPEEPKVFADGPTDSPHRYGDGSLCMWFPYDPPEARWHRSNGPTALLGHIAAHLIKEEYHRQTGRWPGAEAAH